MASPPSVVVPLVWCRWPLVVSSCRVDGVEWAGFGVGSFGWSLASAANPLRRTTHDLGDWALDLGRGATVDGDQRCAHCAQEGHAVAHSELTLLHLLSLVVHRCCASTRCAAHCDGGVRVAARRSSAHPSPPSLANLRPNGRQRPRRHTVIHSEEGMKEEGNSDQKIKEK